MLALVLLLGFGLRIYAQLLFPNPTMFPDSADYHQIALNLLAGKGFALTPDLIATRPPLYPVLVAICYAFGLSAAGVCVIQAFLGTLCIWLQYRLARLLCQSEPIALAAALLLAIDSHQIAFCSWLLTEVLFILLLLGCLLALASLLHVRRLPWLQVALAGCLAGLGCLCRPSLIAFLPTAGICLLVVLPQPRIKRLAAASLFVMVATVTILPWTIRNYCHFHAVIPVTTKTGQDLYEALGPDATGRFRGTEMVLPPETAKMTEGERDRFLRQWIWRYVQEHPHQTLWLAWEKFKLFWNPGLNNSAMFSSPWIKWGVIGLFSGLYLGALLGICSGLPWRNLLLLLLPIVYFSLLHMVFIGSVRYRIPIMPYLEVLAACGIISVYTRISGKRCAACP